MFMALVLCVNVVWMAIELQLEGTVTGQNLNFWPGLNKGVWSQEHVGRAGFAFMKINLATKPLLLAMEAHRHFGSMVSPVAITSSLGQAASRTSRPAE